ncbi:MAG: bifunctional DNA primase/polymerase, partial [Halobacteriota archaeon]
MGDLDNEILNAALEYAKHGWRVLPLVPGEKGPLTDNGFYDASTDEAQIRAWWRTWPKANIGLSVGPDSNLCVIDEDNKNDKDGRRDVTSLERELGPLPVTFTVCTASENAQTGARGTQYYYQFPDALRDALIKKQLAYGVDVKAKGGYVVAAPSVINGRAYAAEGDINNMAELPQAWIDAVKKAEPGRQDLERLRPKGDGSTICEQYGISMGDVLTMPVGARKTGDGYLMSHPEHGATGKGNLFVNPSLNVWCCYRHGTGGDPLTWVAVREGFIDCRDAGRLDSDTVKRCVEVLRRDGLIPELKPVPVDVEDAADALLKNEGLLLAAYRQTIDEYHYGEWALKTLLFRASHRIAFHSNASLVHVDMTGPSRGGKTTLVERHLAFIPHGHKIVFVTTSPKAAWYQTLEWKEKEIAKRDKHGNEITEIIHYQQSNPEYYAGKLIVFFEISDMPGFETFKVLAEESEKSTHTYTTVIQGKAVALQLKGPRGVITTSVSGIQEDAAKQILNRMLQGPIEDKTPENERQKVEMLTRHVLNCTEIESDQRAAVVQRAIERLYHDGLNVVIEPTQGEARKLAEAVTKAMAAHGFNMTNINQFLALCQCGAFEKRFARGDPGCCRVDVDDVREAWFIINTFSAFTQA